MMLSIRTEETTGSVTLSRVTVNALVGGTEFVSNPFAVADLQQVPVDRDRRPVRRYLVFGEERQRGYEGQTHE